MTAHCVICAQVNCVLQCDQIGDRHDELMTNKLMFDTAAVAIMIIIVDCKRDMPSRWCRNDIQTPSKFVL
jgi:hypothetical protein